jgi:threonine dehydrogenase-like Zn-dependent dehydrogenase
MKAIAVTPGTKNSIHLREVPEPPMSPDHVLVKTLRVGLCGTDADIARGEYGKPPAGDDYLILGHENFGVVAEVGKHVTNLKPGDYVVSTVRRPCGECTNCEHGENDLCSTGKYTERGIMRRHGFMSEFYSELPQYLNKLEPEVEPIGVLLEPMTVVEKGVDHCFLIQRRLEWKPKTGVVLGAGPVGMLGAALLVIRGLQTVVVGREPASDPRAKLIRELGAEYFSVESQTLLDLPKMYPHIDLVLEATGSARVVFDSMQVLSPNGILCLLSVTGGHLEQSEPIDIINQDLVLRNNVVFGSVNANPRHFKMGAADLVSIEAKYPGVLQKLITGRMNLNNFKDWFDGKVSGVKTTLEIATGAGAKA